MKEILMSHPISTLRKEISNQNIKGYSKLKKAELVALMLKTPQRFKHIKMRVKPKKEAPKPAPKKEEPKKKPTPKKKKKIKLIKKEEPKPAPKKKPTPKKKPAPKGKKLRRKGDENKFIKIVDDPEEEGKLKVKAKPELYESIENVYDTLNEYRYVYDHFIYIGAGDLRPSRLSDVYDKAAQSLDIPKPITELEDLINKKGRVQKALEGFIPEDLFNDPDREIRDDTLLDFGVRDEEDDEDEDPYLQVMKGFRSDIKKMKEVAKRSLKDSSQAARQALKNLKEAIKFAP